MFLLKYIHIHTRTPYDICDHAQRHVYKYATQNYVAFAESFLPKCTHDANKRHAMRDTTKRQNTRIRYT